MTAAACPRDGGALLLQAVDQRIGLTRRLAACFVDHRNPRRCEHSLQRLFGLALGYEDLCDHDRGHPLAGSSTLNRLELGTPEQAPQDRYKRIVADPQRIVGQIRQRWPRVRVVVRGDAGFCRDELMAWCEAAEGVDYVFGLAQNARLKRARIRTQPQYEQLYRARGDMENRIKEQQLDLFADRTSAATLRANQLRLYWALFAHSLARLRAETPG